ncbi:MAG: hypothetical protein ACRD11_06805 [Terriglobia bacterium]
MKYLLTIETRDDLIVVCRLLNMLRRKGARVLMLVMSLAPDGYCLMALAEIKESEAEHLFHFLRRAEGVRHVTYYRHEIESEAAFVLVDGQGESTDAARWATLLPGAKVIFSAHGKTFLEAPSNGAAHPPGAMPFARVRSTRSDAASIPGEGLDL